ncbi:hypothetical protein AB6F55_08190 [Providencia hangzhouensis]
MVNEHANGLLSVKKDGNTVEITGAVTAGSAGAIVAKLPSWALPSRTILAPCLTNIGVATVKIFTKMGMLPWLLDMQVVTTCILTSLIQRK